MAVFSKILSKIPSTIYNLAKPAIEKEVVENLLDVTAESNIREKLLDKYGNHSFYNDFDSYCNRNNLIRNLTFSLRGIRSIEPIEEHAFVQKNCENFLNCYPKYSKDKVESSYIGKAFSEIYNFIAKEITSVNPYSDYGKLKTQVEINELQSKNRDDNLLDISKKIDKKLDVICDHFTYSEASKLMLENEMSDTEKRFSEEIKNIEDNLQKNGEFKRAIEEYQKLQQKALCSLFDCSKDIIDKISCLLCLNIAICYANLGDIKNAKCFLESAPLSAKENKSIQYAWAVIITYYEDDGDFNVAFEHVNSALKIDANYHSAFLLKQLLCSRMKLKTLEEINTVLDSFYQKIVKDSIDGKLCQDYHIHRGIICLENELYDDAITYFEKAEELGYDHKIIQVNIASAYYFKATQGVPRDIKLMLPEFDSFWLIKAINTIRPIVFPMSEEKANRRIESKAITIFCSACTIMGMHSELAGLQECVERQEINPEIKREILLASDMEIPEKHKHYLDSEDLKFIKARSFMRKELHEECKKFVEAVILVDGTASAPLMNILLQCCIALNNSEDYWKHKDMAIAVGVSPRIVKMYDAEVFEIEDNKEASLSIYNELSKNEYDYPILRNAIFFFKRNNHNLETKTLFSRMHELRKDNIMIIPDIDGFYQNAIAFMLEHDLMKAKEIVQEIDETIISPVLFWRLHAVVCEKFGDWRTVLSDCCKAYSATGDFNDGFNLMLGLRYSLNYSDAINLGIELLKIATNEDKIKCYWALSDLYLLGRDYENSFIWAKKAHDETKTNPYEKSHQAFMTRAVRLGKYEGIGYAIKFKEEHPVVANWIHKAEVNEGDNIIDVLRKASGVSENDCSSHEKRMLEIELLMKRGNLPLHFLLETEYHPMGALLAYLSKHKLFVSHGNLEKIREEKESIETSIVVDAYTLIILGLTNTLSLLEQVEKVLIPYCTVRKLQQMFVVESDDNLKKLLIWLEKANNIVYVADGVIEGGVEVEKVVSEDFWCCCNVAKETFSPYLTVEMFASYIREAYPLAFDGVKTVTLTAATQKLCENNPVLRSEIVCNLLEHLTFISFSAEDLVNSITKQGGVTEQIKERFMIFNSSVNVISFSVTYLRALFLLFNIPK